MKRLDDYKGDEAIELWADLLDPISNILADPEVRKVIQSGKSAIKIAQTILKKHKIDATDILLRIDDSPITGMNVILRVVNLLEEFSENEEIKSFFGFAELTKQTNELPISAMENTEAGEK